MAGLGTTVFEVMSALAREHQSVNLGQGFPDDKGPEAVRLAAADYLMNGHNQYPPMMGLPELRQAVAEHAKRFQGLDVDWQTEVLVTSGRDRGAGRLPVRPDRAGRRGRADRAAVQFVPADRAPGRRHAAAGAAAAADLAAAAQALAEAFSARTKLILFNTPMNPCSKVFDPRRAGHSSPASAASTTPMPCATRSMSTSFSTTAAICRS